MTQSLTFIEIDIPAFTQNSPPDSPVPEQTFRFTTDVAYLPSTIDAIPSIRSVNITPAIISLGGDLGQRATVEVVLKDHKHVFASESYDSGTFWGKFRARYGLRLRGFSLRVIQGFVGQTIDSMETRYYVIENTDGPTTKGEYKIVAKDVLKFADGDRAQAPPLSGGFLVANITSVSTTLTLSPVGSGDLYYGPYGHVAIGGKEIVLYTRNGISPFDVLLIHGDGNSPTDIVDALDMHTITKTGSVTASASQSKFGGGSVFFPGGSNYLTLDGSSDFAFGTGDFTVEGWVRRTATGVNHTIYDSRPAATNGAYVCIHVTAANALALFVNSTDVITGGSLSANVWYHCACSINSDTSWLTDVGSAISAVYTVLM